MKTDFILAANLLLSILTSAALSTITFIASGQFWLSGLIYSLSGASVLVALSVLATRRPAPAT